jgi:hypothetical protein
MSRRRGIGPVRIMMFAGFLVGIIMASMKSASGYGFIQIIGLLSLFVGMSGMVGRSPIKGPAGGLFTGFGLGASFGGYFFP